MIGESVLASAVWSHTDGLPVEPGVLGGAGKGSVPEASASGCGY
jgi:hypothetical protein